MESLQEAAGDNVVGRFAPSPTGRMHAGNIFAALNAWLVAKSQGGEIVLRIEDLDASRSRVEFADAAMRDFEALGLIWDRGPYFQHGRSDAYRAAYEQLGVIAHMYPCYCTRADLKAQSAPHAGEMRVYSGKCLHMTEAELASAAEKASKEGRSPAWRIEVPDKEVSFDDLYQAHYQQNLVEDCGDFILRRADGGFAYQLAVVVDDAEQGVNSVVRGIDLMSSTPRQIFLQESLGLPHPEYAHFPLFTSPSGERLAKRHHAASYEELLDSLGSPQAVLGYVAYISGLQEANEPTTPDELLEHFDISSAADMFCGKTSIEFTASGLQSDGS